MGVLIDANFYLAFVHPRDPFAKRAGEILKSLMIGSYGLLFSANFVISEI